VVADVLLAGLRDKEDLCGRHTAGTGEKLVGDRNGAFQPSDAGLLWRSSNDTEDHTAGISACALDTGWVRTVGEPWHYFSN